MCFLTASAGDEKTASKMKQNVVIIYDFVVLVLRAERFQQYSHTHMHIYLPLGSAAISGARPSGFLLHSGTSNQKTPSFALLAPCSSDLSVECEGCGNEGKSTGTDTTFVRCHQIPMLPMLPMIPGLGEDKSADCHRAIAGDEFDQRETTDSGTLW